MCVTASFHFSAATTLIRHGSLYGVVPPLFQAHRRRYEKKFTIVPRLGSTTHARQIGTRHYQVRQRVVRRPRPQGLRGDGSLANAVTEDNLKLPFVSCRTIDTGTVTSSPVNNNMMGQAVRQSSHKNYVVYFVTRNQTTTGGNTEQDDPPPTVHVDRGRVTEGGQCMGKGTPVHL